MMSVHPFAHFLVVRQAIPWSSRYECIVVGELVEVLMLGQVTQGPHVEVA